MTLTNYPALVQGSEEWLAARRGIVTASVVGRLVTAKPFGAKEYPCPRCDTSTGEPCLSLAKGKTGEPISTIHVERVEAALDQRGPDDVTIESADDEQSRGLTLTLASERITGHVEEVRMTDAMWRGVDDEPIAREFYAKHVAPVTELGFMVREFDGCQLGYSPDGLVGEDGLIEIKSRIQKRQLLTVLAGEVPAENMAQLQAGLFVSGRKWIDYVSYTPEMVFWIKRVWPDSKWFRAIEQAVKQFEKRAAEMVADYSSKVAGLPVTDPRIDLDAMVI